MAIAEALLRLTSDDLKVEAGATVETTVQVGSVDSPQPDAEAFREYVLDVRGLPDGWYTLSTKRLRLSAGELAEALLAIHPPHDTDPVTPLGEYQFAVAVSPESGGEGTLLPGRLLVLPPGGVALQSRLLDYLPAIYRSDPFIARFLLIFQSIFDPIEESVDSTHHLLDPGLTPARFLPWLASWLGIELDPGLDEAAQRDLIRRAVDLARWKGTRRGLREELRIRTGGRPLIVENFDGMRLGQDASLGLNTHLGVRRDHCIAVTLATNGGPALDQRQADSLVEELKPAHVGHVVRIVSAPSNLRGGGHG